MNIALGRHLRRSPLALAALIATVAGAGAATAHRFAVATGSGSEGAFAYNQTTASASALQGTVASSPVSGLTIPFGVLGDYAASSTTFGVGVVGISTSGYGVGAETFGGGASMIAIQKGTADAADFYNEASGNGASTVLGASTGEAVIATSESGNAAHPVMTLTASAFGTDLFTGTATDAFGEMYENVLIQGTSANRSGLPTTSASDMQLYGDLYVVGKIYQACQPSYGVLPVTSTTKCEDVTSSTSETTTGVARKDDGQSVATYAAKQSLPTMEDFGGGRLTGGVALVRLDPTFAHTISKTEPYRVFLTPNGESRGLYVTQKTAVGFVVRENAQGRSTLDFDYRVVAAPLAGGSKRFPAVAARQPFVQRRGSPNRLRSHAPAFRDLVVGNPALAIRH